MDPKLVEITEHARRIGSRPDYVQGGGGNVSIKLNANTMAIKASGYRLEDIYPEDGIVILDHTKLEKFFETKNFDNDLDLLIKENETVVNESVFDIQNIILRPSIETGFHAILGESVIHTHSIYVNTLTCTEEGRVILSLLFPESIYIPYKTPGVALTLTIRIACIEKKSNIIFLENHGIITIGNTPTEAMYIHEYVNERIREYLNLSNNFNVPKISLLKPETYTSYSPELEEYSNKYPERVSDLSGIILFPDQVVYTHRVSFNNNQHPITITGKTGIMNYKTSQKEAQACAETISAWLYIMNSIQSKNLTPKTISKNEGDFILNLASEKYRQQLIK